MSILDDDFEEKATLDLMGWSKFQNDILEPRIKKLIDHKPVKDFACGVYVPNNFNVDLGQSLKSFCRANSVLFHHLNCSQHYFVNSLTDFIRVVTTQPCSVILLENFDKIPNELSLEREYIENILVRSWEHNFLTYRNRFLVVFSTSENYGEQVPELLKKIKSLHWYGSIR